jgi:hypothetical protein
MSQQDASHGDDILVYIESFEKENGIVLFDFVDSNEFAGFNDILNFNASLSSPSMVLVKNYFLRSVQENTMYAIKRETFGQLMEQGLIVQDLDGSFIIGYRLSLNDSIKDLFDHSVALNDFEKFFRTIDHL